MDREVKHNYFPIYIITKGFLTMANYIYDYLAFGFGPLPSVAKCTETITRLENGTNFCPHSLDHRQRKVLSNRLDGVGASPPLYWSIETDPVPEMSRAILFSLEH